MKKIILSVLISAITLAATAQNVGVGNSAPLSKLDLSGDLALREGGVLVPSGTTVALLAAKYSVYRITASSPTITTINPASGSINDGMMLTLIFEGSSGSIATITNATGTNNIQTNTGANLVSSSNLASVSMIYNTAIGLWVVTGSEGFISSSASATNIYTADGSLTGNRTVTLGGKTLSIGADAASNNITLGSASGTSTMTLNAGSGGVNVKTLGAAGVVTNTAAGTLGTLAGTTTTVLHGNASGLPAYSAVALTTDVTGVLPVANGGTGVATLASNGILYGNGTGVVQVTAASTAAGQILQTAASGGVPSWVTPSSIAVTSFSGGTTGFTPSSATTGAVTLAGTLNVANGGTGLSSTTVNGLLIGGTTTTGALQNIGAGSAGQILTSNGTIPSWTTPASTTSGFGSWTKATTASTPALKSDNQYVTGNVGIGDFSVNSPQAKLQVTGGGTQDLIVGSYGTSGVQQLLIGNSGTSYSVIQAILQGTGVDILALNPGGGKVGIGTSAPGQALEVVNNNAIKIGDAYLSSGGTGTITTSYTHLANDEYYNGSGWVQPAGIAGALYQQVGQTHNWFYHAAGSTTHTAQMSLNTTGLTVNSLGTGLVYSTSGLLSNATVANYMTAGLGITFSGTAGNTINSVWTQSGNNIYNNNSGNVGIGAATSPTVPLHVRYDLNTAAENWVLRLQNNNVQTNTPTAGMLFGVGDDQSIKGGIIFRRTSSYGVGNLYFLLNNNAAGSTMPTIASDAVMTMQPNGNIGIGTTGPSQLLDVNGTAIFRNGNSNTGTANSQIEFGYNNTTGFRHFINSRHNAGGGAGNDIDFYLCSGNGGTAALSTNSSAPGTGNIAVMTLENNYNSTTSANEARVGIGTTAPGGNLHVYATVAGSTASMSGPLIVENDVNATPVRGLWLANNGGSGAIDIVGETFTGHSGAAPATIRFVDANYATDITFRCKLGEGGSTLTSGDQEVMRIRGYNATTGSAQGCVGIGTTSPSCALDVENQVGGSGVTVGSGNNRASYYATAINYGNAAYPAPDLVAKFGGRVWSTVSFDVASDRRIKNIIGTTNGENDLATIRKLRIVDYTMKDKIADGNKQYKKVIAQEVAEVYPNVVSYMTDYVPDIFSLYPVSYSGDQATVCLDRSYGIKAGDKVRLMSQSNARVDIVVTDAVDDAISFKVPTEINRDSAVVFVYGRQVHDKASVDYDGLTTLNISATQELAKQLDEAHAEIKQLKQQLRTSETQQSEIMRTMKAQIDEVRDRLNMTTNNK